MIFTIRRTAAKQPFLHSQVITAVMSLAIALVAFRPAIALEGFTFPERVRTVFEPTLVSGRSDQELPQLNSDGDTFEITVNFVDSSLSASQQSIFTTAAAIWDLVITGYQPGINIGAAGPAINASAPAIDGPGMILGQAGPVNISDFPAVNFSVASTGIMQFDSADVAALEVQGTLLDVIVHEMGHVIGIGTLWDEDAFGGQEVSVAGTGEYTGANGLAAYQSEFNAAATFVPVEQDGGPGTVDSHWDELGINSNVTGLPLSQELMTGFLSSTNFISTLTARSLIDLGFTVNPSFQSDTVANLAILATVPEPTSFVLIATSLGAILLRHRRF